MVYLLQVFFWFGICSHGLLDLNNGQSIKVFYVKKHECFVEYDFYNLHYKSIEDGSLPIEIIARYQVPLENSKL